MMSMAACFDPRLFVPAAASVGLGSFIESTAPRANGRFVENSESDISLCAAMDPYHGAALCQTVNNHLPGGSHVNVKVTRLSYI